MIIIETSGAGNKAIGFILILYIKQMRLEWKRGDDDIYISKAQFSNLLAISFDYIHRFPSNSGYY